MGVWERSPAGISISMRNPGLLEISGKRFPTLRRKTMSARLTACAATLSMSTSAAGVVSRSRADAPSTRAAADSRLCAEPCGAGPPLAHAHPEYFVQGNAERCGNDPASFIAVNGKVFALGRDPYFPAWPDVVQLNAFQPALRQAVIETVLDIAEQCDGVRCDMAMLMLNDIFARTWGARAGVKPSDEYWTTVISAVKAKHPRVQVHRRGLLGPRVGTATKRF